MIHIKLANGSRLKAEKQAYSNISDKKKNYYLQSLVLTVLAKEPVMIVELHICLRDFASLPLIRWLPPARRCLTFPVAVILILLPNPL
jgi:hypothetical protein